MSEITKKGYWFFTVAATVQDGRLERRRRIHVAFAAARPSRAAALRPEGRPRSRHFGEEGASQVPDADRTVLAARDRVFGPGRPEECGEIRAVTEERGEARARGGA